MSSDTPAATSPPSPGLNRRSSYAPGQKLTELFGRPSMANGNTSSQPGPIAAAAANASAQQRRRMSVSSIGLSGTSPTQTSPFMANRPRKESQSSTSDESAIDESGDGLGPGPGSQFTRRLSFGARAMRDARAGSGGIFGNGRTPKSHSASRSISGSVFSSSAVSEAPATAATPTSGRGEGFSFSDQMRSRAERGGSWSANNSPTAGTFRAAPPKPAPAKPAPTTTVASPPKEMPRSPRAPDHFQERILKGDFYMD